MENKINLVELLRDCPSGMELDCPIFEGLEFVEINDDSSLPIRCRVQNPDGLGYNIYNFTKYGCWNTQEFAKCVIFPKGKTTWEGFKRSFKDGDILSYQLTGHQNRSIYIYKYHPGLNTSYYVALGVGSNFLVCPDVRDRHALNGNDPTVRLATDEEKEKLFKTIKDKGFRWDGETKTLMKLPQFKVGDRIKQIGCPRCYIIKAIEFDRYILNNNQFIRFGDEHIYELVPNKFDINTLIPFESRVLVRHHRDNKWCGSFFSHIDNDFHSHCYKFVTTSGKSYPMCIPYEGNEHLLGTTNDCDEYYVNII